MLSKLIRDQLRVRNDKRSFKLYGLRKHYISHNHPCGKLHTNISYKKHTDESEKIINARLNFFRKRSIYYSGWSMEDWWDEKLRTEEKEMREKQKQLRDEDKRVVIGNSQQERLQEAAKREISNKEFIPKWPKRICREHVGCPTEMPLLVEENTASAGIVGYLNMTPVNLKCKDIEISQPEKEKAPKCKDTEMSQPEKEKAPKDIEMGQPEKEKAPKDIEMGQPEKEKTPKPVRRSKPYLPIKLHWKKMDKTVGYPQLKVTPAMAKCGYYTG